jgi:hypothetical protein
VKKSYYLKLSVDCRIESEFSSLKSANKAKNKTAKPPTAIIKEITSTGVI